ncbi:MAG: helix-turn-helix domain-containing protein [Alphaproteobacteria bacterium]|nr:helix-turn-helix domain-containing protein [Alphaproteobacteria bacterium]
MDLLSDILNLMQLSGTLYFRTSFTAPWGIQVPQFENVSRFHYVHRGRCFAHVKGQKETVALEQGDLIIITRGAQHTLSDPVDADAQTVDRVVEISGFSGRGALIYGEAGAGHETQLICGHFAFDPGARHILLDALPAYLLIKDYGKSTPDWLDDTLKIIGGEAGNDGLGSDLIALKLSEIIFTQAIRKYLSTDGRTRAGLAGFSDSQICRALEAIHSEPSKSWTVEDLARVAGLSRTSFSNRFSELLDHTPLNYLTAWRMQIARRLLIDSELPIIEVAEQSGYRSEAAFGRVFKRHFEIPPASYRRMRAEPLH